MQMFNLTKKFTLYFNKKIKSSNTTIIKYQYTLLTNYKIYFKNNRMLRFL